ncbi:tetratricopeptide repeat protein [Poritiphilus flavus]|uniref:Tetratricopeptide repeat protein n=1 Tax=Poritiphilus flavus TaxID=2697053 RepID=A0A6L9EHF2_9FLAO|nr:tetratricopeptide repeat protein [Poritiphilus flavus]NAS14093.1 tetratricopeptide repeat protein [Poritiphilus flavus]
MKTQLLRLIFLLVGPGIFAQEAVNTFVEQGIQYHDQGEYDKAIETYQKALELVPQSALVNYELALSHFAKGDYEKVIAYSDVVLDQNGDHMLQAYLTKGSALDVMGKTKESIKLFEKAIKKTEGHYLLHYNLAVNYYKLNELEKAEEMVIRAIERNRNHPSSHLMLANIHHQRGNTVQTLLASHYFLFLEPDTPRAVEAYHMLQQNFGGNVSRDSEKPNTINILLSPNNDSQFGAAELMVSMLEASRGLEENQGKTEDEMFIKNTDSFFTVLGELKRKKDKEIWWTFYTTFFYELAKSDHMEAYCHYIAQGSKENSKKWLIENGAKLMEFDGWLKEL